MPERVFKELLRIGRRVVVSFPNFANWRCRVHLSLLGRSPVTRQLPFRWHNSPNIHFFSLKDFDEFCDRLGVRIEQKIPLAKTRANPVRFLPNLLAEQAVYVTSKPDTAPVGTPMFAAGVSPHHLRIRSASRVARLNPPSISGFFFPGTSGNTGHPRSA